MNRESDFTVSTGNVFADLNVDAPEEAQAKAGLAYAISEIIAQQGWTQVQAADVLRIDQPKVSALMRGRLSGFSLERLLRLLNALDQNVVISASPKVSTQPRAGITVVIEAGTHTPAPESRSRRR